jgi:hypothetical protein
MVSVLVSRAVYRGLYPLSDRSKYLKSGICCFFALQAALRSKMSKNKVWLALSRNRATYVSVDCVVSMIQQFNYPVNE